MKVTSRNTSEHLFLSVQTRSILPYPLFIPVTYRSSIGIFRNVFSLDSPQRIERVKSPTIDSSDRVAKQESVHRVGLSRIDEIEIFQTNAPRTPRSPRLRNEQFIPFLLRPVFFPFPPLSIPPSAPASILILTLLFPFASSVSPSILLYLSRQPTNQPTGILSFFSFHFSFASSAP